MASSAGAPGVTGQSTGVGSGDGGAGGGGDGGAGGAGGGGKGNGYGSAPTSWNLNLGGKGKGKMIQIRATGPGSSVQHSFSLPHPDAIAISSHTNIGSDGTIEDASMTAQFEYTDDDGVPCGASAAMSIDSDGTATLPSWLDSVKTEIITWRE